jgi:oligopeptide transport system ATP-binding protein
MTMAARDLVEAAPGASPLLELVDIEKLYRLPAGLWARVRGRAPMIAALGGVRLAVQPGEILGLVGESGSGKSTLSRIIVRLSSPSAGRLLYRGADLTRVEGRALLPYRRRVQMIFQDSHSSLNPRKSVNRILSEALAAGGTTRNERPRELLRLLRLVGLGEFVLARYPHELSGGQRQRIGIARSLAMNPELLVADEPVSSLDVSLQGQIINLLTELSARLGLTLIFISHDLAVVHRISTRIAVMYAGRIVEIGRPAELMAEPAHPYTAALILAVPKGIEGRGRRHPPLAGALDLAGDLTGCPFRARCVHAMPVCTARYPDTTNLSADHSVACHLFA